MFEVGFIIAIFHRWSRWLFALGGQLFHTSMLLILGIPFYQLQTMYVAFLDLQGCLKWVGSKLWKAPLNIGFDKQHMAACRLTNLMLELDWLSGIKATSIRKEHFSGSLDRGLVVQATGRTDDISLADQDHLSDKEAFSAIAWRLPILWPVAALMFLPMFRSAAGSIYQWLFIIDQGDPQTPIACLGSVNETPTVDPNNRPLSLRLIVAVGAIMLFGMIGTGFTKSVAAWPVACYPTFDAVTEETTIDWPQFWAISNDGSRRELDDDPLRETYGAARYVSVLRHFVSTVDSDEELAALLADFVPLWHNAHELEPTNPPQRIEVTVGHFELTSHRRPAAPVSSTKRLSVEWEILRNLL